MNKHIYSILWGVITLLLISIDSFSVAPMPGLGLQEPQRPLAPFSLVSHNETTSRQRMVPRRTPAINMAPRGLLILVNFSDVAFASINTRQAFDSLANGADYRYNGADGSCQAYFKAQSNGQYVPHFDVVGPVSLSESTGYYGANDSIGNDRYVVDFLIDACRGADKLGVDFSQYDNDNDGIIDFVYVIYAGYAESEGAPENTIWPHNWDLISALYYGSTNQTEYYAKSDTDYNLPIFDGKMLNAYACSNELRKQTDARCGIGTICHEFSHVLGLPDYYLTTSNPVVQARQTPGYWSLMGSGNYLNNGNTPPNYSAYDKYYLGWLTPEVLDQSRTIELPANGTTAFLLARNERHHVDGPFRKDTVYYIENRQQEGWDTYLPGHGMLIWRVIFDEKDWYNNSPNDYVARYLLVSAKNTSSPYSYEYAPKPEVPFPGSTNKTEYAPFKHSRIESIQESADGLVSFDFFTEGVTALEDVFTPEGDASAWYNLLGQKIDPQTYKGIAIHNKQKYLLR